MHYSILSITILAAAFGATFAHAQAKGLHNTSKDFTAASDITHSDIHDPQEIKRTWDAAIIMVPTGPGVSKRTTFAELQAQFGDGAQKFPTAIHMHGCSGIWPGTLRRAKFLANNGFLVIAPASMAREKYARSCNVATQQGGLYRDVLKMRHRDAGFAIETAKTLPYVDADNMLLTGLSEGGITAATFKPLNDNQRVSARVIEGWTCTTGWYEYGGVNAPQSEPVLAMVAKNDPWFQDIWTKGSCDSHLRKDNQSVSIVYASGKMADSHELLEFRAVQSDMIGFLKEHIALP